MLGDFLHFNPDALLLCDRSGTIVNVNEQCCSIFGYCREELLGGSVERLLPAALREPHPAYREAYWDNPQLRPMGQSREVRGLRKDQRELSLEIRLALVTGPQGPLAAAAVRDVTELRVLDNLRKNSNAVLEQIATGQPALKVLTALLTGVEAANPDIRCAVFTLDRSTRRFVAQDSPRLPAEVLAALTAIPADRPDWTFANCLSANDTVAITDTTTDPNWTCLAHLVQANDLRSCWSHPVRDSQHNVLGVIAAFCPECRGPSDSEAEYLKAAAHLTGITLERDLRNQQLAAREEQLRQLQKSEALGTMAGGIAHEFNNLLQVIHGYTVCALEQLAPQARPVEDLARVKAAAEHARALTRQLVNFSRRSESPTALVELNGLVQSVGALARPLLGTQVQVIWDCAPQALWVRAHESQLRQLLLNLCLNARDAMPAEGTLKLTTHATTISERRAADVGMLEPGPAAVITVADTGSGMSAEVRARIFDPFFTTKEVGRGTGLGLSVVFGIVQQHKAALEVESVLDHGTTFRILFPASVAAPSVAQLRDF